VEGNFTEEKNVSGFLPTVSSKITMKNIDLNMNGQPVVLNIRDYFVTICILFSFTRAARCGIVTIKYTVARLAWCTIYLWLAYETCHI